MEPTEDHRQGRFRVYVHLVALAGSGWPAATDSLDCDLKRLSRGSARNRGRSAPSVAAMTTSFTLSILRLRHIVSLRGG